MAYAISTRRACGKPVWAAGLSLGLLAIFLSPVSAVAGELDTVKARLVSVYLQEDASDAQKYLASQKADGSWPDIDYASKARSNWDPANHLFRLRTMAIAYNQPEHPAYRSAALLAGIDKGLAAWFSRRPTSDNWWQNDIGPQNELAPTLLSMQPFLSAERIRTAAGIYVYQDNWTGQNLVWFASQLIFKGCLLDSLADVRKGVGLIAGEIRVSTSEGIQPDFSFHQHGAQLYSANYGFSFPIYVNPIAYAIHGLSFGFAPKEEEILVRYLLEGLSWMSRRGYWGVGALNREISRPNTTATNVRSGTRAAFASVISQVLPLATGEKAAALRAFLDHTEGRNDGALTGNKYFWRSDFMAHRRPAYLATLRMSSTRVAGGESINDENLKGRYVPFGSLFFQMQGDEFYGLFPVLDWSRIPGVTAPHKAPTLSGKQAGTTDFVGGASDGRFGVAALDLDFDGVTGHKSWFFLDQEVVALGADIRSSGGDSVLTSVNQTALRGDVWTGSASRPGGSAASGPLKLQGRSWVHHDGVGYILESEGAAQLRAETQTGAWTDINKNYSNDRISKSVFSLWMEHGIKPAGETYAYRVLPGATREQTKAAFSASPVRILVNTRNLQAVTDAAAGITGAAFFAAGQVEVGAGLQVKVDKPCLAIARIAGEQVFLSVSNPVGKALVVSADLLVPGKPAVRLAFNLPGEAATAGSTVTLSFPYQVPASADRMAAAAFQPFSLVGAVRSVKGNRIDVNLEGKYAIEVISLAGRTVAAFSGYQPKTFGLPGNPLPTGIYLVRVVSGSGVGTVPLMLTQ